MSIVLAKAVRRMVLIFLSFLSFMLFTAVQPGFASIESPETFFGFKPGADRMLFDYKMLVQYLQKLDQASPRLKLQEIGSSPMGKRMYTLFISSEENIADLEQLKQINRRLALDPGIPAQEREGMLNKGKVFVLATLSMHSSEVGPTQSLPRLAHELATTEDAALLKYLDDVVYMIVPCHNPDGMDMIVEHYLANRGTKYEGSSMPGVYHKYLGHDNNRDFITLTQSDTKAIATIYSREWFPQVMVEKHQMGSEGPRYFVPPPHDPIAENIDAGIWNWSWIFGSAMAKDMTEKGLAGVAQHYLFDDYWPGSTETCIWKNVIGFLTEAASVKIATPIFIEPTELEGNEKGLAEYKKSINMSLPWNGGWWRLNDIVEYEIQTFISILKTASQNRYEILKYRNDICRKEIEKGMTEPPFYYLLFGKQHDMSELVETVNLLREHGVEVYRLSATVSTGEKTFNEGDIVIPLAQSFRPFIKEVMDAQSFPVRHFTPGGELMRPYDVTSWSLPLHRGLKSVKIQQRSKELESNLQKITERFHVRSSLSEKCSTVILSADNNESYMTAFMALDRGIPVDRIEKAFDLDKVAIPAGSFLISLNDDNRAKMKELLDGLNVSPICLPNKISASTKRLQVPRIALVESYQHDMDAGWTRFIFDSYHIPYRIVRPADFGKADFSKDYDVVIFPDQDDSILKEGKEKHDDAYRIGNIPPEFTKGIGDKGMEALMTFIDGGGIIVSWGRSAKLFMDTLKIPRGDDGKAEKDQQADKKEDKKEEFQLPIRNLSKKIGEMGIYCPGALLRANLITEHPLTFGMEEETGVFYDANLLFSTSFPRFDMDRRVIASFPEKEIFLSGYCENEEKVGNKTAMAWFRKGKGQFILFSFNPIFRGTTHSTFKLVFNSILLDRIED